MQTFQSVGVRGGALPCRPREGQQTLAREVRGAERCEIADRGGEPGVESAVISLARKQARERTGGAPPQTTDEPERVPTPRRVAVAKPALVGVDEGRHHDRAARFERRRRWTVETLGLQQRDQFLDRRRGSAFGRRDLQRGGTVEYGRHPHDSLPQGRGHQLTTTCPNRQGMCGARGNVPHCTRIASGSSPAPGGTVTSTRAVRLASWSTTAMT
jgi:hypothetical protein